MRSMTAAMKAFPDRYAAYRDGDIALHLEEDSEGSKFVTVDFHVERFPAKQLRGLAGELDDINKNAANLAARNRKKNSRGLSKHASHLLRLLSMGSELLETGEVNTWREDDRKLLLEVKAGKWLDEGTDGMREFVPEFWEALDAAEKRFKYAKENTDLPERPDEEAAYELMVEEHRRIVENGCRALIFE